MGAGQMLPSIHRDGGWIGQFDRMTRWYYRFEKTQPWKFDAPDIDYQHDILFTCFQNIFHLKDWLINDAKIDSKTVYDFINRNIELKICRDICNGTKHFDITQASVDTDFTIMREYQPFHKMTKSDEYRIIVIAEFKKYELKELARKSINLWVSFVTKHLDLNE
ncbi:hypothetical protein GO009_06795 [Muricauda sp. TY007]|uniref:hypothetical protein n=1 Tax=Allomuricauda sp. TY007 TaxID=2683200 RepID=UPI0013BFE65E|nr:hypothetical protein [Muricauda sp. TY007]NDV15730.1 hypothetical protein [Muricauda sp. TY007]